MDIREKNKACAITRWQRIHRKEQGKIRPDNNHLARICGYLAGDGTVKIRKEKKGKIHYTVEFFPDDISLITPFKTAFENVYSQTLTLVKYPNHYRLRVFSKVVTNHLLSISTFGLHEWKPPESILISRESKIEWLRAFFDAEAYVGKNCIRVQSVNSAGLKKVKELLEEFGIFPKTFSYTPKNPGWSKVYILNIGIRKDRKKFLQEIGFNHKQKMKHLRKFLSYAEVA